MWNHHLVNLLPRTGQKVFLMMTVHDLQSGRDSSYVVVMIQVQIMTWILWRTLQRVAVSFLSGGVSTVVKDSMTAVMQA
jgi:hypothetical protein